MLSTPNLNPIAAAGRGLEGDADRYYDRDVVVAILAKDKAETLPLYLSCLSAQTFPKNRIHLYIRANDSTDETNEILQEWVSQNEHLYMSVFADYSDLGGGLTEYSNHQWSASRFAVLAQIRNASVKYARQRGCHYFVCDLDNFIVPETLEALYATRLPVVGPMLRTIRSLYSNYHFHTSDGGYYLAGNHLYRNVWEMAVRGLIMVNVIHCAYFIRHEILGYTDYVDDTPRHEYVIFSEKLRKLGIPQYIDNRKAYGLLTFLDEDGGNAHGKFDEEYFTALLSSLAAADFPVTNVPEPPGYVHRET